MAHVQAMERRLYRISHAILWCDADCADAVQEAVFRGWMARGSLREEKYFETWLIRILINECRSQLRRQKLRPLPMEHLPEAMENGGGDTNLQLREALQELPEKYRMPLLLHHLEGYSLVEIGQMLGITAALVKSRLHQARKALRRLLEDGGEPAAEGGQARRPGSGAGNGKRQRRVKRDG